MNITNLLSKETQGQTTVEYLPIIPPWREENSIYLEGQRGGLVERLLDTDSRNSVYFESQIDTEMLKQYYIIENDLEFRRFLISHWKIREVLFEAPEWIKKIFGTDVEIHIRIHSDYEEDYEEAFIIIKSHFSSDEALERLNRLDEAWFLEVIDMTEGYLNITEEPL